MEAKWKEWFDFPARERRAILILGIIVIGLYLIPFFVPAPPPPTEEQWQSWIRPLVQNAALPKDSSTAERKEGSSGLEKKNGFSPSRLFYFDPNEIGMEEWKELGLSEKTAGVIINYRNKGGRFRKPEDLERIYSIPKEAIPKLLPYVRIAEKQNVIPFEKEKRNQEITVYLNKSTAAEWQRLPGIGPVLAKRIEGFRLKLGGFHAIQQVSETYGLEDSVFQKIKGFLKEDQAELKKIPINSVSEDSLASHPYIRRNLAKLIVAWRNQHQVIGSAEDLNKILPLAPEKIALLIPYLDFRAD